MLRIKKIDEPDQILRILQTVMRTLYDFLQFKDDGLECKWSGTTLHVRLSLNADISLGIIQCS